MKGLVNKSAPQIQGFDLGRLSEDATEVEVHPSLATRVQHLGSVWLNTYKGRNFTYERFMDEEGHGTHVCASICGSGLHKSTDPEQGTIATSDKRTAPGATLMVQSLILFKPAEKYWKMETPVDLASQLFQKPYNLGVNAIDRFVYGHQNFIVLTAAGNNGDKTTELSQIGAAAAAKNCITVGSTGSASQNDRQNFIKVEGNDNPGTQVVETVVFSSQGPTLRKIPGIGDLKPTAGRIKPDIVAPGVAILSAASRGLREKCRAKKQWKVSDDNDWIYASGTSMSTPLVAGCIAVLREAL
ncbi:hypothetical protein IL306_010851 [Fusarium sp. DS 682]|nr:hypothetical protein IL306_010851 [Fusarium sp. DS 682]